MATTECSSLAPPTSLPNQTSADVDSSVPRPVDAAIDNHEHRLHPHNSNLPLFLYLLSFAPPLRPRCPTSTSSKARCSQFLLHPFVLYALGMLTALPAGLAFPAIDMLYGFWMGGVGAADAKDDEIRQRGQVVGRLVTIVAVVIMLLIWAFQVFFTLAAEILVERLRYTYVASAMAQDSAFFESVGPGEISTRASTDIDVIRTAFGVKMGFLVWSFSNVVAALSSSFAHSSRLGGVLFSTVVLVLFIFGLLDLANRKVAGPVDKLEGRVASFTEQILSSVRIVQSYNMGPSLFKRLDEDLLKPLERLAPRRSAIKSLQQSSLYFALFLMYSLGIWYAGLLVRRGSGLGNLLTTMFNTSNTLFVLSSLVPLLINVSDAMVSLKAMRQTIERRPTIDVRDDSGIVLPAGSFAPSFALNDVTFAYPSRPTVPVLRDVSLRMDPGSVTAIVGPSGSGKSTLASLLIRQYDPETANIPNQQDEASQTRIVAVEGEKGMADVTSDEEKATTPPSSETIVKGHGTVLFAGRDVREYNLRWLRSQIAVVSQHPQLFTATVFENVAAGLTGTELEYRPDIDGAPGASFEIRERTAKIRALVVDALRKAQASQFVEKMPDGMDTMITGGRAGLLSGGQRQRLAIARALVRSPACLLLDEATSALDAATEEKIRVMLEKELEERGMTTLIVAHRFSTIAKANRIIVMKEGRVVDQGRYEELMEGDRPDTTFRQLAIAQLVGPTPLGEGTPEPVTEKQNFPLCSDSLGKGETSGAVSRSSDAVIEKMREDVDGIGGALKRNRHSLSSFLRLLKTQRWFFFIGGIAGLLAGSAFPIAGWLIGGGITSLSHEFARPSANTWSTWLMVAAVIVLFIFFVNAFCLEVGSGNIVRTLKRRLLETFIKQDIGFFDEAASSTGGLTSAISTHPANIDAATGLVTTQLLIAVATLTGAIILACVLDWSIAVICLPAIAATMYLGWLNSSMLGKYENVQCTSSIRIASYVSEAADSVMTITTLGREQETMRVLSSRFTNDASRIRYLILGSGGFAMGQATCISLVALLCFWCSRRLADHDDFGHVIPAFEAFVPAAFGGSRLFMFGGDYGRASQSFQAIQLWFQRKPNYTSSLAPPLADRQPFSDWASGDIVFNDVEMRYPLRPDCQALHNVSFRIVGGQTHAFCGMSGSGKTTILALMQRFYDPIKGTITIGGIDHRLVPLNELRSSMAYVSQDAVLFEGSIRWNLSLSALDPSSVSYEEIKSACQQAHIWHFVCGLEKGLETEVGMKGADLSGGQRQRLCIARALIRNPKILLLDEATSALDSQSEELVGAALERASKGRTTIVVAHRLNTIRRCDVIHVVDDGVVKESGSHDELMQKRGAYFDLVQAQP